LPAPATMNRDHCDITEIFSSIQGEGPYIGFRQIFIRFSDCNLECAYCDTGTGVHPEFCLIEESPGSCVMTRRNNPIGRDDVVTLVEKWLGKWPGIHHSISLTGGEPLLNHVFLNSLLPELRKLLPVYLETNGTLCAPFELLSKYIDYVSMDIKIPSTSHHQGLWDSHREFLERASGKKVFIKVVIGETTENWEIHKACEIIAAVDKSMPLILQPMTFGTGEIAISQKRLLDLHTLATGSLREVRIIPQTHKFLGLL